jgi:hypothetical protein
MLSWHLALVLGVTLFFLFQMFRPYQRSGDFDFGMIFRLFWFFPMAIVWIIYLVILLVLK